jgi:hypothetical protein
MDVDALIESINQPEEPIEPSTEGLTTDAQAETEVSEDSSDEQAEDTTSTFNLVHKGKEISVNDENYRQYAQKGYDYESKMKEFNVERKMFQQEREKFQEDIGELKEINEYAKQNPEFERIVKQQWELAQQGRLPDMQPQDQVSLLEAKVNRMQELLDSQKQESESRRVAELEVKQESAISKFKDEHSYLDWETKDEHGQTLEDRVGEKMLESGVRDFNLMAKAMLMEKIVAHKALESKENVGKDIQKANKLGLGKVTKKPQMKLKPLENARSKSWDEVLREAMDEEGITA